MNGSNYTCLFLCLLFVMLATSCAEVSQSESCKKYVACLKKRDISLGITTNMLRFESDGVCWGSPAGAGQCTRACTSGLEWLQKSYKDLPGECK